MTPTRPATARLVVALALPVLAVAAASPAGAAARPDLVVRTVADPPARVAPGATLRLRDTTRNRGTGRAAASATRFYLAKDPARSLKVRAVGKGQPRRAPADVLLVGARKVPALRSGATSKARRATVLRVPRATRPGTYALLACADDRGAVRERDEARNCRAAARHVVVARAAGPSTPPLAPQPDTPPAPPAPAPPAPAPAPAPAPPQGDADGVFAMSDVFELPDPARDHSALAAFAANRCGTNLPVSPMTAPAAIASLRGRLTEQAGPDAMAAFAASPEHADPVRAQKAAVAAVVDDRPGAALAALLRAHELQPGRAAHLRNAASLAASMGHPSEALALLDAAAAGSDAPLSGMGIGGPAAALATRGQALAMLGQWGPARDALRQAVDAQPLLAEAAQGLATATACTDGPDEALPIKRRSRSRRTPVPALDLSQGQDHPLRPVVLPASPGQAVTMLEVYREGSRADLRELSARGDRRVAHEVALRAKDETATPASVRRRKAILARIARVADDPQYVALHDRVEELQLPPEETVRAFWGNADQKSRYSDFLDRAADDCPASPSEPYDVCFDRRMQDQCVPALRAAHQTWADQVSDLWRAGKAAHERYAKLVSALGAHLADPDAVALVRIAIEEHELATFSRAGASSIRWIVPMSASEDHCVDQPVPAVELEEGEAAGSAACTGAAKQFNAVAKLDDYTLKVNCEGVEAGGSLPVAPWFAGFAEGSYDVRTGKMTLFAGAQVEVDTLQVVKGAFKSGIYLTVDRNGIQDIGWRTGPSATAGAGAAEFQLYKDEIDMSFVGAFDALTGVE